MTQNPPHPHQHHGPVSSAAEDARVRLLDLISSGALRPGDRLGTERELAARLSVSRSTLRQVLAVLAQAGTVRRVPGRTGGTFVAHTKVDRDLSVIVGLPEYLRERLGMTVTILDPLTPRGGGRPTGRTGPWQGRGPELAVAVGLALKEYN